MKNVIDKIRIFLDNEKIPVKNFECSEKLDDLFENTVELAINVEPESLSNWKYFGRKINCCSRVADLVYNDNVLRFIFVGTNSKNERELLEKNLEIFYNALLKRYFTVCPLNTQFSILVKPTHRCNLDCKYCYDKPYRESIKEDMTLEILDRMVKLLSEHTEKVIFIWHGGEPTLVSLDWYKKAYEEIFPKYPMIDFEFSIMSNGINYNEEWFEFFKKYNIKPGASYNSSYQTQLRCSSQCNYNQKKEMKLSKKIEESLKEAKNDGLDIGVIEVITGLNYKNQIEIYEYYKNNKISLCMNHIFHTTQTEKNKLEVSAKEYSEEFIKYFKHWLFDKNGVSERSAEEALASVIGLTSRLTCKNEDCRYKWLCVNPLGEIYPCDRYFPEKYKVGTVFEYNSINDALQSKVYQMYSDEIQCRFDSNCKKCGYWFACKGDCNGSAVETTGSAKGVEKFVCEQFRIKYNEVYEIIKDLEWIDNNDINPTARKMFVDKGFFSVKEIKKFMKDIGMKFKLEYNKRDLLGCSEHVIFRGINFMEDSVTCNRHVDFVNSFDKEEITRNKERRKKELISYLRNIAIGAISLS